MKNNVSKKDMTKIAKEILTAMERSGYSSPWEFYNSVKPPMSYEAVRRLFDVERTYDESLPLKKVGVETVIKIAHAAGCSHEQIHKYCTIYGDKTWMKILRPEGVNIPPKMSALMEAVEEITKDNLKMWEKIADALELLAMASGKDINSQLKVMA